MFDEEISTKLDKMIQEVKAQKGLSVEQDFVVELDKVFSIGDKLTYYDHYMAFRVKIT